MSKKRKVGMHLHGSADHKTSTPKVVTKPGIAQRSSIRRFRQVGAIHGAISQTTSQQHKHVHNVSNVLIQGGTESERYHLSADEQSGLTDGGSTTLHDHDKNICIMNCDGNTNVAVSNGAFAFLVPARMDGAYISTAIAAIVIPGAGLGMTEVQIRRVTTGVPVNMLSHTIRLGPGEYTSSDGIPDPANKYVATGDILFIDVKAITTIAPKGLSVTMTFERS